MTESSAIDKKRFCTEILKANESNSKLTPPQTV